MVKVNGIDDLLEKIENLRASLRLSDEILPLVSDMFLFIKDIIPLMLETNAFMRAGTQKLPSATDNLNKVTQTTEMATQEVMDRLEKIIGQLDELKESVKNGNDKEASLKMIDLIQNETADIFYAFQFQDITSQQLEYVNRILKAIYVKFVDLFQSSLKLKANTFLGKDVIAAIEKELEKGPIKEELVSFESSTTDYIRQDGISQELIDKYFKTKY